MSDDDKIQAEETNGQSTQIERDEAFCNRMFAAIRVGLENAPIGVVNPKYVATQPPPLASVPRDMEHV